MRHRDALWMALIVAALAAITVAFGERIGVNGGVGWDGQGYVEWSRDFPRAMFDRGIPLYSAQRVLPSAIIYASLGALGIVRTTVTGILAFQGLDAICLVVAAYLWGRIALVLAWSRAAAWAGFAAVFASFAIAREALYYPALIDSTAFALGMAMTWAFLARRPIALWLVALASAFAWPALTVVAMGLLIAQRRPLEGSPMARRFAIPLGALAGIGACALALYFRTYPVVADIKWLAHIPDALVIPTLIALAAWVGIASYVLARKATDLRAYLRSLLVRRTLWAIGGAVAISLVLFVWLNAIKVTTLGPDTRQFACELALESLRGPLWGLVHHVVYYGPIIIVAIAAWPRVAKLAASWGLGALLALAMIVAFAVGSESRQWIHMFPLLATLTIAATHDWWTPRRAIGFAVLCLAWSKLWWPIHYDQPTNAFAWPALRYYMQHGPWASDETFLWHAAAAVATAFVLFALRRIK